MLTLQPFHEIHILNMMTLNSVWTEEKSNTFAVSKNCKFVFHLVASPSFLIYAECPGPNIGILIF